MTIIDKLKRMVGDSDERTIDYQCTNCDAEFSLPESEPVVCPDCDSRAVVPESDLALVDYRCNDCNTEFSLIEGAEAGCPSCGSDSLMTTSAVP